MEGPRRGCSWYPDLTESLGDSRVRLKSAVQRFIQQKPSRANLDRDIDLVFLLVNYMTMIRINVHEAKTRLSYYLTKLKKKGETIILSNGHQPIAEIRPLPSPLTGKRPIGLAKGKFCVSPELFASLPDDVVEAFSGKTT